MIKIKSFKLQNGNTLESRSEGNEEEGRSFEYYEKNGIVYGTYKAWGWVKTERYHPGSHPLNSDTRPLPRDKWTRFNREDGLTKFNNTSDIIYE